MKEKLKEALVWFILHSNKWWVQIPYFFIVFLLVQLDIILVPVLGVVLAVFMGCAITLNYLDETGKVSNDKA